MLHYRAETNGLISEADQQRKFWFQLHYQKIGVPFPEPMICHLKPNKDKPPNKKLNLTLRVYTFGEGTHAYCSLQSMESGTFQTSFEV